MVKEIQSRVEPVSAEAVGEVITSKLPKFTKAQLVKSQKYFHRSDALNALLETDQTYSFAQVDAILKKFDEGGNK